MRYRCVNDLFGYCSGTPEWGQPQKHLALVYIPLGQLQTRPLNLWEAPDDEEKGK